MCMAEMPSNELNERRWQAGGNFIAASCVGREVCHTAHAEPGHMGLVGMVVNPPPEFGIITFFFWETVGTWWLLEPRKQVRLGS